MAIVNEIKCSRCDRKYSGVRSRCPYCGARRIGRGKYSEDSDNARGKMLISVLIMGVFAVAAGVLLFTADADAVNPSPDPGLELTNPEDDVNILVPPPPPSPVIEPSPSPVAPLSVDNIEIWVAPNSHTTSDFSRSITREGSIDLTVRIYPAVLQDEVDIVWEIVKLNEDDDDFIEFAHVTGGITVLPIKVGTAKLRVTAGDKSTETFVRVTP